MNTQLKGLVITLSGVLIIVPDSLLIRLIDADAMTIVFWRSLFGFLAVMGFVLISRTSVQNFGLAAVIFMVSEAIGTLLFVYAIENTSVASTLFLVSTAPVFSALLGRIVIKEALGLRIILTIVGALIGIAIIASEHAGGSTHRIWGDLAALGVAISLAIAFTAVRNVPSLPVVPALAGAYLLATLIAANLAHEITLSGMDWVWVILNGGIFVPLGFALLAIGPRYIPAAEVSLLLLLEAVLAPALVWAVLGEFPGDKVLLGGAIVLAVLFVSNLISLIKHRNSQS